MKGCRGLAPDPQGFIAFALGHQQDELPGWAFGRRGACCERRWRWGGSGVAVVAEAGVCGMAECGTVRIRGPVDGRGQTPGGCVVTARCSPARQWVRKNPSLSRILCCMCMAPVDLFVNGDTPSGAVGTDGTGGIVARMRAFLTAESRSGEDSRELAGELGVELAGRRQTCG